MSGGGSGTVAPYRVGYEIKNQNNQTVVSETFNITFNTISGYNLSLIYADGSTQSNFIYWVTNTPTANQYWDTTGLPPGEYTIKVIAEDIGRPSVNRDDSTLHVIIPDTTPPDVVV